MTDPHRAALLRLEVARLRARRPRRVDPAVHVGALDGPRWSRAVPLADPLLDAGTRLEVLLGLLEDAAADDRVGRAGRADEADVWLTRAGEPEVQDADLAWLAAALQAFDVAGCALGGVWAVTRTGWLDVRTGEHRVWKRLRVA